MFQIKEGTPADKVGEGTAPETIAAVEAWLAKQGKTIRTADQDKSFVKANSQPHIDEAFGIRNKQMEDDIISVTGLAKLNSDEKYFDFFKRALKDFKDNKEKVTDLAAKLETAEKAGGSKQLLDQLKGQLADAQNLLVTKNKEFETKEADYKNKIVGVKIQTAAERALGDIKPKLRKLDASIEADVLAARMAKFSSEVEAVESEGQIIYKTKADGKVIMNQTDGKPKNVTEILEGEYFKDLIDTGRKAGGAGSGKKLDANGKEIETPKWKEIKLDTNVVKTKIQLHDHLVKEHKMDMNSKEFQEAYGELGKDLPLR